LLDPESEPLGVGRHTFQSKIAIGLGGLYGKGWRNGIPSQLNFVPEPLPISFLRYMAKNSGFWA
jgi:rod shape determining protein RodA